MSTYCPILLRTSAHTDVLDFKCEKVRELFPDYTCLNACIMQISIDFVSVCLEENETGVNFPQFCDN